MKIKVRPGRFVEFKFLLLRSLTKSKTIRLSIDLRSKDGLFTVLFDGRILATLILLLARQIIWRLRFYAANHTRIPWTTGRWDVSCSNFWPDFPHSAGARRKKPGQISRTGLRSYGDPSMINLRILFLI